ncbi:MAG TPA: hypothetical protein VG056_07155, partial [Pirellulales bacterium]|nr:hypothetical protein [Pirellulales bacterium]
MIDSPPPAAVLLLTTFTPCAVVPSLRAEALPANTSDAPAATVTLDPAATVAALVEGLNVTLLPA